MFYLVADEAYRIKETARTMIAIECLNASDGSSVGGSVVGTGGSSVTGSSVPGSSVSGSSVVTIGSLVFTSSVVVIDE